MRYCCWFTYFVGSGSAEGFHNRLNHNMPRNAMSLDKMVDYLAAEDEYWKRTVNDQRLWAEKKTSHSSSQERHRRKRQMLKNYVERGNDVERSDAVDQVISSDLLSSDGENERVDDDIDVNSSTITTTTSSSSKPLKQRKPRKPNPTTPMHERCLQCRLYKFNYQCSLTMCKACCISSPAACKYTHHRQAKLGARQPSAFTSPSISTHLLPVVDIKERLEKIVQAKGEVFISYEKGTNSKVPRRIKPNAFSQGKEGELVHAYCHVAKDKCSFYLHHITKMDDHNWENNSQPSQLDASKGTCCLCSSLFFLTFLFNSRKLRASGFSWGVVKIISTWAYWPAFSDNGDYCWAERGNS